VTLPLRVTKTFQKEDGRKFSVKFIGLASSRRHGDAMDFGFFIAKKK